MLELLHMKNEQQGIMRIACRVSNLFTEIAL